MGLCRTVSEINGDFSRKLQNFPIARYCARAELGIGTLGQKTRSMGLPGCERSLTISSIVWTHCTNVTDKWTPRDSTAVTHSIMW